MARRAVAQAREEAGFTLQRFVPTAAGGWNPHMTVNRSQHDREWDELLTAGRELEEERLRLEQMRPLGPDGHEAHRPAARDQVERIASFRLRVAAHHAQGSRPRLR